MARIWADRMRPFGTIVIENQGGGGGTIGAASVAHAKPDGYTLLFGDTSSQIIAPYLLLRPPYDGLKDFVAVSMMATSSTAVVVNPKVPATNLDEFIKYAQDNQARLSYASAGTGTVTHLAGELFKQLTKTPAILHVPYRGAGPGLIDVISGVVPMMTPNVTSQVLDFHRAGNLRILAVCAPARDRQAERRSAMASLRIQLSPSPVVPWGVALRIPSLAVLRSLVQGDRHVGTAGAHAPNPFILKKRRRRSRAKPAA